MILTAGVAVLPEPTRAAALAAVQASEAFYVENAPYGEHDFGAVTVANMRIFWRIDAYDRTLAVASPDPTDPMVTARVLTIMLAEEYKGGPAHHPTEPGADVRPVARAR